MRALRGQPVPFWSLWESFTAALMQLNLYSDVNVFPSFAISSLHLTNRKIQVITHFQWQNYFMWLVRTVIIGKKPQPWPKVPEDSVNKAKGERRIVRVVCLHLSKRTTLVYFLLCCSDSMQYSEYIQDTAKRTCWMNDKRSISQNDTRGITGFNTSVRDDRATISDLFLECKRCCHTDTVKCRVQ